MMNKMITENTDPYLPEWSDWGDFLARGIKIFGASFIYSFPIIIFMMGGYFIMVLPAFLTPFAGSGEEMAVFGMLSFFGMFAGMFIFAIGMFLSIFLLLLLPPILSNVAAKNSFSAAFHFHEWWRNLKANFSGYLISIILMVGLYFFIMLATQVLYMTLILCILIPFILFPATAYLSLIMSSLFAATYRQGAMKLNPVVVTE
jgi:hypothetical protein